MTEPEPPHSSDASDAPAPIVRAPERLPIARTIGIAVGVLLVGLVIGFFVGRKTLEAQWNQPFKTITADDAKRSSSDSDANPTPAAGARVLKPIPIQRARKALTEQTRKDPAVATVGSLGEDDESVELHLVVENHGKCVITALGGTGYAYDARGRPAQANKRGESYFAFTGTTRIEPGAHATIKQTMKHIKTATVVIATIDSVTCADGTGWKRP